MVVDRLGPEVAAAVLAGEVVERPSALCQEPGGFAYGRLLLWAAAWSDVFIFASHVLGPGR